MAITLVKGQNISLQKEGGGSLSRVVMGLGWDPVQQKKGFFSKKAPDIDLDASVALFDEAKNVVDIVSFQKLRSSVGSILHTGDNLTGAGDGDDEQIKVNLDAVPANVKYLAFVVTSYRGQTFNDVDNAFCRLVDETTNKEIARYTLSGGGAHTAMIMAKLYRHQCEWKMHALGDPGNGKIVQDLLPSVVAVL